MYMILKPESRRYIELIDAMLKKEGFQVTSRHPIDNWAYLARKIYEPQIDQSKVFASEFECYLWLCNHFFGNAGAALLLQRDGELLHNLQDLTNTKNNLRKVISNGTSDAFRLFFNVDKIDPDSKYPIGTRAKLGIGRDSFDGRWDYFFFKYIHVPDPKKESYEREMGILRNESILERALSEMQWRQMSHSQTLVCPDLHGGTANE